MKRLLCGTVALFLMSVSAFANTPDASTSTTTESVNTERSTNSGDIQEMEEESERTSTEAGSAAPSSTDDAQLQQAPGSDSATPGASGMDSSAPSEDVAE